MSACSTFTEHVWKPGECKNCFKPKSLHCLAQSVGKKPPSEQKPQTTHQQNPPSAPRANPNLTNSSQRAGSGSARSGHFRPPVAKKPTIAVKPTMMLHCSSVGLDSDGNLQHPPNLIEQGKTSAFTAWNRNGLNHKRPGGFSNSSEREDGRGEVESYGQLSPRTPSGNNNSGLADVLKEIAGLGPGLSPTPLSGSKDMFWGRISSSYRRSLERGLPASSCLAMGSSSSGGGGGGGSGTALKRVSLSDSNEIISTEGGRFCYPEFSSEGEDDEEEEDEEEEETERDEDEHESWDESDEELLAMEIRMRGQPRFANFRAATLSPVPFAAGKKWNTVPLRNRSLQRICAVDYDDSYDEILNGYPSMDCNGALPPYGPHDMQGSGFLSNSESITSPESSSSLPEDSQTTSSSGSSALNNGLQYSTSSKTPVPCTSPKTEPVHKALSPFKTETHKAVLAIRLEDQDSREGMPMPQALPGQPVTISFSPTEEQAKPYRVVNLEKSLICKPYTVVDVSASMSNKDEQIPDSNPKPKNLSMPSSPTLFCSTSLGQPLSPTRPVTSSPVVKTSPTSVPPSCNSRKKLGSTRYQEVWTSSTSPRQKIPKMDVGVGINPGPSIPIQHCSHKSAPTSPIAGLSSSRTVPVKSPNLSEIKFNSFNNAGMPPFPIIIRDEPAYARSSKNAVKVPIVINPSAYDNLAVYKSFLGLSGELPQSKHVGNRVTSHHTYEEIGSSESVQTSSTEKTVSGKGTSERASFEETKPPPESVSKPPILQPRTTIDASIVTNTVMSSTVEALSPTSPTNSPAILAITANLPKTSASPNVVSQTCKTSGASTSHRDDNQDFAVSAETAVSDKEEASAVLFQIVASIHPPQSPPESPSEKAKTLNSEELYALPPDATKETLTRPKSLFSTTDGCLSKPKKDTPSKVMSKSQSASAAVPLSSPRSEPSAPFPPPRSTSSPYHAANILQRHFGNWTKSSASSSPLRPSEGEASPSSEGRRISADSSKPKRWISFKSFFRRRKDEDEQREKGEREKEKGKLVGLDGTVIHMLPPPPIQQHHWFTEAKPEDPTQKPTIIFSYKPESGINPGDEGELQVEECKDNALLAPDESKKPRPLSPGRTAPSQTTGCDLNNKDFRYFVKFY